MTTAFYKWEQVNTILSSADRQFEICASRTRSTLPNCSDKELNTTANIHLSTYRHYLPVLPHDYESNIFNPQLILRILEVVEIGAFSMTSFPQITISGKATPPLMDQNYEILLQEQPSLVVAHYNF